MVHLKDRFKKQLPLINMKKLKLYALCILIVVFSVVPSVGQINFSTEKKGLNIFLQIDNTDAGLSIQITITNNNNRKLGEKKKLSIHYRLNNN